MNASRPRLRTRRISLVLIGNLAIVLLFLLSACDQEPFTNKVSAYVTICAIDTAQGVCVPGDYQAVGKGQKFHATVVDTKGKPLANAALTFKINGANSGSHNVTTNGGGAVDFTYTGTKAGDDSVTAVVNGDGVKSALSPGPALIHWLKQTSAVHPILYVHGTNEDATDFTVQMKKGFTDPNGSDFDKRTFTALFEALTLKYDPKYLEALCYVDDHAYDHGGAPSGCRFPLDPTDYTSACAPGNPARPCESQGSVNENALQLANTVNALSAEAALAGSGTSKVTLIAYSMGGAVVRTLLAGCPVPVAPYTTLRCPGAAAKVDHVFFIDSDQQGSWLLTINKGYNAAALSGDSSIPSPITPFASVLPMLQQTLFAKVKSGVGLDANAQGIQDQTPQSPTILAHDQNPIPSNVDVYNFLGDVQVRLGVTVYGVPLTPGQQTLNLGDFVMLAQNNSATQAPLWGGGGLCDGCSPTLAAYRENGPQYHNWVLMDQHSVDMSFMAEILNGTFKAGSPASGILNSPVQHLNITQPPIQSPGSARTVRDITGHTDKTDMSTEIFYILTKADGVALP